jgi:hypothetical protein
MLRIAMQAGPSSLPLAGFIGELSVQIRFTLKFDAEGNSKIVKTQEISETSKS